MQNLLIIEHSLTRAYFLTNNICKNIPNIRLYNVSETGLEAIEIIQEKQADIIILDLELPDMSGVDILEFITKNNLKKYIASIIVITNNVELLSQVIGNRYIYSYHSKANNIDFVLKKLQCLIEEKEKYKKITSIRSKIKIELEKLNFNFSYIGTRYLYDCIYECYGKEKIYNINLNKSIYPILSKKYNRTISSIKTSIFQAISKMYCEIDENTLWDYLEYRPITKPKTKDIIECVIKRIKES